MFKIKSLIVLVILFTPVLSQAAMFKYVDDEGKVWYVDSKEKVPVEYKEKISVRGKVKIIETDPAYSAPTSLKQIMVLDTPSPKFKREMYRTIEIIGEDKFVEIIKKALNLIRYKAIDGFILVRENVGRIQQGKRTRMWVKETPPTMTINKESAYNTDTFTAGILVHEAYHSKLYREGNNADPTDFESMQEEEIKCIKYEAEILRKIGAPQYEIDMAEAQEGDHFDVNNDGGFDLEDYKQIDW